MLNRLYSFVIPLNAAILLPSLPLFNRALIHATSEPYKKIAIIDRKTGTEHTYFDLLCDVALFRARILREANAYNKNIIDDLQEARIAFICPNGYEYVVAQWSIWAAGGIAVPLCIT